MASLHLFSRRRGVSLFTLPALLVSPLLALTAAALDPDVYADPAFQRTWERTDKPVEDGAVPRTWVWGAPVTGAVEEPYVEAPGQSRLVQYFDKTRMEITDPSGDQSSIWYVTNGLLVVELIGGRLQSGDNDFGLVGAAQVNVAGDPLDPDAVTYADLTALTIAPPSADGSTITQRVDSDGVVTDDESLASYGVTAAQRLTVPGIDHQIASVFWDYMHSTGLVWENGGFTTANLFPDPYYATGYPKTEPYWTNVDVGGVDTLVLLQCFERRCLTYTPTNAPEWRVEMGNVGLHYHAWRYDPLPPVDPEVLFTGYLDAIEPSPGAGVPRREPNAEPVPSGTVSIGTVVHEDFSTHLEVQISTENAGVPIGYELRYSPPGIPHSVVLTRSLEPTDDLLVTDTLDNALLEFVGIGSVGNLHKLLKTGQVTIVVKTLQYPEGAVSGTLTFTPELTFRSALTPFVESPGFGNAAFYYDAEAGEIEYTVLALAQNITGAYIAIDADPDSIVVDLTTPVLGVPTSGSLDEDDLEGELAGQRLALFAQELFNGNASVVVTTAAHPDGELAGRSEVMDPRHEPKVWFFVMTGNTAGRGTGVLTWNTPDQVEFLVTSADLAGVTGVELREGVRGQNGPVVLSFLIDDPPSGEINGVLGEWIIHRDELQKQGLSFEEFAYRVEAQRIYALQTTADHPDGAIRGQGQFPYGLQPHGLYLAELTNDAQDASITVMFFYSGAQAQYLGEAITWDMYCNGVEGLESVQIFYEGFEEAFAELIANEPSDALNGDGYCGSGAITLDDVGPGEPWTGPYVYWPPDGWLESGGLWVRAEYFAGELASEGIRQLWVDTFGIQ